MGQQRHGAVWTGSHTESHHQTAESARHGRCRHPADLGRHVTQRRMDDTAARQVGLHLTGVSFRNTDVE